MTKPPSLIPYDILRNMASACAGDQEAVLAALQKTIDGRTADINRGIFSANMGLSAPAQKATRLEENKAALSDINKILKHAEALKDCLQKIDIEKSSFIARGLEKFVHGYIYSDEPDPDLEFYTPDEEDAEAEKEIDLIFQPIAESLGLSRPPDTHHGYIARSYKWDAFFDSLEKQITVYKAIQVEIQSTKKTGRPKVLKGLTEFIYQIALLYQDATGRPFTVDEHRENDAPTPITEGMIFASLALESVYRAAETLFGRPAPSRYTPSNFQNACAEALKRLRQSEKP